MVSNKSIESMQSPLEKQIKLKLLTFELEKISLAIHLQSVTNEIIKLKPNYKLSILTTIISLSQLGLETLGTMAFWTAATPFTYKP